jgi:hypothetical protein
MPEVGLTSLQIITSSVYQNRLRLLSDACMKWVLILVSFQSSMALQHFVGPWSLLLLHRRYDSLDGDQPVGRPLPAHRRTQTQNKRVHRHVLSGIRTHNPSVRTSEDTLCLSCVFIVKGPIFESTKVKCYNN